MEQYDDNFRVPGTDQNGDPLLGRIIAGKYQVEHLLGRGGMGSVYQGRHLLLDRPIAIKVMQTDIVTDETAAARFLREAKAAAKIEHPNAITIHDFGILQDNTPYIVMEHVRGVSLRQWLDRHGLCEPASAVEWLSEACCAVAAGHLQGIIHRDLKPENIMLKEIDGGGFAVKVVDFGLAKLVNGDSGGRITKTNEVIGTPHYMAPEFYQEEGIDHRVDVYALGIIIYEMLCGHTPFNGTIERIIAGHLFNDIPPLRKKSIAVTEEFDQVIAKALMKAPEDRFESAIDFASALKEAFAKGSKRSKKLYDEAAATLPSIDIDGIADEQVILVVDDALKEAEKTLESIDVSDIVQIPEGAVSVKPTEKVLKRAATALISTDDKEPKNDAFAQPTGADLSTAAPEPSKRRLIAVMTLAVAALIGFGSIAAILLSSSIKPVNRAPSSPASAPASLPAIGPVPPPDLQQPQPQISNPKTEIVPIDRPSSKKRIDAIQNLSGKPASAQAADKSPPVVNNAPDNKDEELKTSKPSGSVPKPTVEPIAEKTAEKDKEKELEKKEETAQDEKKKKKSFFGKIKGVFKKDK